MDGSGAEAREGADGGWKARLAALLYPPHADIARRNRVAYVVLFALVPVLGSILTLMLILLAGWALISVLARRFPFRLETSDRPIVLSCLAFVGILGGIDLVLNGASALLSAASLLLFILPLLFISRMRVTAPADVLPNAVKGLAIGGTALGFIVVVEHLVFGERVAGLMGNPGPLSVVALFTAGGAFLHLSREAGPARNVLALTGTAGALLALFLTGMRGAWLALPLIAAVVLWARRRDLTAMGRASFAALMAAITTGTATALLLVLLVLPGLAARLARLDADADLLLGGADEATSLSLRWDTYRAALDAFSEAPLLGHGLSRLWPAVVPHLRTGHFETFGFSHLHNAVLTMGVAGGILGLAAWLAVVLSPLAVAARWRDEGAQGRDRLAFAAVLVLAFLVPGMTNIMFMHDILDAVWVFAAVTLAASVPAGGRAAP